MASDGAIGDNHAESDVRFAPDLSRPRARRTSWFAGRTRSAQFLERLPRAAVAAISLTQITLAGVLDFMTGYELSVSVFGLVSVTHGAW